MCKLIKEISAGLVFAVALSVCSCQMFGGVDKSRKGKGARQTDVVKSEGGIVSTVGPTDIVGTNPVSTETSGGFVPPSGGTGSGIVPDKNNYNNEIEAVIELCYAIDGVDLQTAEKMINEYFGVFLVVSSTSDTYYDTRYYEVNYTIDGVDFDSLQLSANKETGKVFQVYFSSYHEDDKPGVETYDKFYKYMSGRYGVFTEMNEEEDFLYSYYSVDHGCEISLSVYYVPGYSSFSFDFNDYNQIY